MARNSGCSFNKKHLSKIFKGNLTAKLSSLAQECVDRGGLAGMMPPMSMKLQGSWSCSQDFSVHWEI